MSELDKAKQELKENMEKSLDLIKQIDTNCKSIPHDTIYSIYELSFLKIYLSWEIFISRVFILYMMGKNTNSGYAPRCYVSPKDENHAYQIIKGGRRFADWLNLDFVIEVAEMFFEEGEPFKSTNSDVAEVLQHMKILRNKIVHASQEAEEKYQKLLRDKFGSARPITPGQFLSSFKNDNTTYINTTYIVYYTKILEVMSDGIVK